MAEVELTIAGRSYRVACRNGEEANLMKAGALVDQKSREALSGLGTRLMESPGVMYAEVVPPGRAESEKMLVQLETSAAPAAHYPSVFARDRDDEERLMVSALAETLAPSRGRLDWTSSLPADARKKAEWLLDNIVRLRGAEPSIGPYGALRVYRLHLVTNTEVTAKGLVP